ncbi:MAG: hypothetical protein WCI22_05985 [Actinomycetota bacterium]
MPDVHLSLDTTIMDERPLLEQVLDVVLYAPVGLAAQLRTDLPRIVDEGRSQLESRVKVAHWVGEMSVQFGRRTIEQKFAERRRPAEPDHQPVGETVHAATVKTHVHQHPPFDGYDQLAATQIVQLLGRLPHGELRLVREYEADHRNRRTVLAKIEQLLAE